MSRFITRLVLQAADDIGSGLWIVAAPFAYESDVAKDIIVVPIGFHTDLASVPRLPLVYWLTGATANEAAVIHDYLYSTQAVSREIADAVLREASELIGVPAWRRQMMWAGVRLFGGSHWETKSEPTT